MFVWLVGLGTLGITRLLAPKQNASYAHTMFEVPAAEAATALPERPVARPRVFGMAPVAFTPAKPVAVEPARRPAPAAIAATTKAPAAAEPALGNPPPAKGKARDAWDWANLWNSPSQYLVRRTWLGSPESLSNHLSDPAAVDHYLSRPLVRATLESPTFVRLLAGNRALAKAFIESPAMQDPKLVKELLTSPLMRSIMASPGVQAFIQDPTGLAQALGSPELANWVRNNPAAGSVINEAGHVGQGARRKG